MSSPQRRLSLGETPSWMESYPKLMEQMRDIMEEWKDEREQLLTTAEQTHAYCQSLAFQVKSMQEENGRLQKENAQLIQDKAKLEQILSKGVHGDGIGSAGADEKLVREHAQLTADKEALQQELDRVLSEKALLEQENQHLIEAIAMEGPGSSPKELTGQQSANQSRTDDNEETPPPHSQHDPRLGEAEARLDRGTASLSEDERACATQARETPNARSWSSGPVWVSDRSAQPVHGIAVGRAGRSMGEVGVVSWDGSCTLLRASNQDPAPWFQPVWSVFPGKGLYSVAFGSAGSSGSAAISVLGVASMDGSCYVLDSADGSTLFHFRGHQGEVNTLHFQPESAGGASAEMLVASGSDDTMCLVWAPAASRQDSIARLVGHSQAVYGVKFHPVHPSLLATVAFDQLGKIWDLRTGAAELDVVGHSDDIIGLDFSPSGTLLATGSDDCTCRIWDLRKVGPNGAAAAAAAGGAGRHHMFCLQHEDEVKRLEWSPCGSLLATASSDGHVNVWQAGSPCAAADALADFALARSFAGHQDTVFDVAWLPAASAGFAKGSYLLSASHDFTVKAWGALKGAQDQDGSYIGTA